MATLRTWTNEDGVFIHMGDLADSLDRHAEEFATSPAAPGMQLVANVLRKTECQSLRDALARRPSIFGFFRKGEQHGLA